MSEEVKAQPKETVVETERVMTVPDLHCRFEYALLAEERLKGGKCDRLVFLGDYCDSFTHSNHDMQHTVEQVIRIKKENPDKVELLIGNHDLPYISPLLRGMCSGHRPEAYPTMNKLFSENDKLFNIAYQKGKHLFTHAGVTNRWRHTNNRLIDKWKGERTETLAETLNKIRFTHDVVDLYSVGMARGGVRGDVGGPLWADMVESIVDALLGYHQYVGHTPIRALRTQEIDENTSITYLDLLPYDDQFKIFEI